MSLQTQRRVLTALAALLGLVVAGSLALAVMNRTKQGDIQQRSQFIQQSVALERLNAEIVRALAELALRGQDKAVTALLNANGVTFSAQVPQAATAAAPTPSTAAPASNPRGVK